jgi:hypothetical protein
MGRIFRRLRQLRFRSLNRDSNAAEIKRPIENADAWSAAADHPAAMTAPPGYVKDPDEHPRH